VEASTHTVQASLLEMRMENDEDIQLVIADPRNNSETMIAEFPNQNCTDASIKKKEMEDARSTFLKACGVSEQQLLQNLLQAEPSPPSGEGAQDRESTAPFIQLSGSAMITGVGFFDTIHGQAGVAPNGIELHPVLQVENVNCTRH
jgi:hypothetical protein